MKLFVFSVVAVAVFGNIVQGDPWMSELPKNATTHLNDTVEFWCHIQNLTDGGGLIMWRKIHPTQNTLFINTQRGHSSPERFQVLQSNVTGGFGLRIAGVQTVDRGQYECSVFSTLLRAAAWLEVQVVPGKPVMHVNKTNGLKEGDIVQMSCASSGGHPEPLVTWYRDGSLLSTTQYVSSNIPFGEVKAFVVVRLTSGDHLRNYSCHVSNAVNARVPLVVSTQLNVQFRPNARLLNPNPLHAIENTAVTLRCEASGNPSSVSFAWRYNGSLLPQEFSPTLEISPARLISEGEYQCEASNSLGTGIALTRVTVLYGPKIQVPSEVSVVEGRAVTLTCKVNSLPAPYSVTWGRADPFDPSVEPKLLLHKPLLASPSGDGKHTVRLSAVDRASSGSLVCTAKTRLVPSEGPAHETSATAVTKLNVQYVAGPATVSGPSSALVGTGITLRCAAENRGNPASNFRWTKDGQFLGLGQELRLSALSLADAGNYSCLAVNSVGSGLRDTLQLVVNEPPSWLSPLLPGTRTVRIGVTSSVTLTCILRAKPAPTVMWLKDGVEMTSQKPGLYATRVQTEHLADGASRVLASLDFNGIARVNEQEVQASDAANYTCRAYTTSGAYRAMERSVNLLVEYPPSSSTNASVVATDLQTPVILHCFASGFPQPNISWEGPDGQVLQNRTTSRVRTYVSDAEVTSHLVLTPKDPHSLGAYRCLTRNVVGHHFTVIQLKSQGAPEAPSKLKFTSLSWGSARVTWTSGFDGGFPQRYQLLVTTVGAISRVINVPQTSEERYNISALQPATNYTASVRAVNHAGSSAYSNTIALRTTDLNIPIVSSASYSASSGVLRFSSVQGYCVRVERQQGPVWQMVARCVTKNQLSLSEKSDVQLRLSVCLQQRPDVCGKPVKASVKSEDIPDRAVIIASSVCAAAVVILLVALIFVCVRKRGGKGTEKKVELPSRPTGFASPISPTPRLDRQESEELRKPALAASLGSTMRVIPICTGQETPPLDQGPSVEIPASAEIAEREKALDVTASGSSWDHFTHTERDAPVQQGNAPSAWSRLHSVNGSLSSEESGYQTESRKKVFYEVVV